MLCIKKNKTILTVGTDDCDSQKWIEITIEHSEISFM